ncbi:hypothetical protein TNCV_3668161 [Trichonephila clavipes]|nr:hypothetical protein TNCV_3668161 [Trichonephila clavipes]
MATSDAQFDRTYQIHSSLSVPSDTATSKTSVLDRLPPLVCGNRATSAQIVLSCQTLLSDLDYREKEITAVKIKEKISYPEARHVVLSRTPVSGKSYAGAARKSTSNKCIQCTEGTDNSSDSATPTNPEVIAKIKKSNSPPKTKVIAKQPSKSPPPAKKNYN